MVIRFSATFIKRKKIRSHSASPFAYKLDLYVWVTLMALKETLEERGESKVNKKREERRGEKRRVDWKRRLEKRHEKIKEIIIEIEKYRKARVWDHLIGAPRDWAGFSRMVMVVSVSFSGASDSYSGIMGADDKRRNAQTNTPFKIQS